MDMVIGPGLIAGAAALFAWAYVAFRRPDAGRWTTHEFLVQLITVAIASLLALGVGYSGSSIALADEGSFSIAPLAAGLVLLVSAVLACRWAVLKVRRLEGAATPPSVTESPPKPVGTAGGPSRPLRKAA